MTGEVWIITKSQWAAKRERQAKGDSEALAGGTSHKRGNESNEDGIKSKE